MVVTDFVFCFILNYNGYYSILQKVYRINREKRRQLQVFSLFNFVKILCGERASIDQMNGLDEFENHSDRAGLTILNLTSPGLT